MSRSRFWLCAPPVALALLDGAITLIGQPVAYWAGDFAARHELNPIFDVLLAYHPIAFVGGLSVWILSFSLVISLLPETWAMRTSYLLSFAHALGAAAWLARAGLLGWLCAAGLFAAAQRFFWYSCWRAACAKTA